jgi:hypothetical protein
MRQGTNQINRMQSLFSSLLVLEHLLSMHGGDDTKSQQTTATRHQMPWFISEKLHATATN